MRIIVMEPDAALGFFLKKGLTLEGHEVEWTDGVERALELAETSAPDLMVVDVMGQQGLYLLATIREMCRRTALLALISENTVEERVRCLDLGSDDCVAKPFSFQELTARCRALLRRQARQSEEEVVLMHGTLVLNRIARSASAGGRQISFTVREFRLLEHLLQNAGRCCSRSELLTEVFQLPSDNATNVVDVYINYLRKKLAISEGSPRIMTMRGAGYSLGRAEPVHPGPMLHETAALQASV